MGMDHQCSCCASFPSQLLPLAADTVQFAQAADRGRRFFTAAEKVHTPGPAKAQCAKPVLH